MATVQNVHLAFSFNSDIYWATRAMNMTFV